jgi:arginine kinase
LTRDVWTNMKKKSTSRGGNIQICVKSGVERPQCPIGALASDDEAYKTFGDLFTPIIKDLHPDFDFRYSYKFDDLKSEIIDQQINEMASSISKIADFQIDVSRNFSRTPFAPLMTKEAKLQVERKVVEVLGDLYGSYT